MLEQLRKHSWEGGGFFGSQGRIALQRSGYLFFEQQGRRLSSNTESPSRLYLLLDRTERPRWHLYSGMCQMVQVLRADLLDAMKDCLRDLENVKLLSPDDLDILDEKRILRQKIDELENEDSDGHEMSLTSPIVQSQQWRVN